MGQPPAGDHAGGCMGPPSRGGVGDGTESKGIVGGVLVPRAPAGAGGPPG
eukprot:gene11674-10611_t